MKRITGIVIATACFIGSCYAGGASAAVTVTYTPAAQSDSGRYAELCEIGRKLKTEGATVEAMAELMMFSRMSDKERKIVNDCYEGKQDEK